MAANRVQHGGLMSRPIRVTHSVCAVGGLLLALALGAAAGPAGAASSPGQRPLPDVDARARDGGPVSARERAARRGLQRSLGGEGVVTTDRITGATRMVGRTDGLLTGRRRAPAADVALDYVRARADAFGLGGDDLARLRLTSSYRSADGVTHLAYVQTYRGIDAYDNVLLANVDDEGRLVSVGGSAVDGLRVSSIEPRIGPAAALLAARRDIGARLLAPRARQGGGPERPTRFTGGDSARLTLFNDGRATRLAWRVVVTGARGYAYELVVDAADGAIGKRRSLTALASTAAVYRNHPGATRGGTSQTVDLAADPAWLNRSAGGTRLSGNNAHAYVDADAVDADTGTGPSRGDLDVPASAASDWQYPQTPFHVLGQACPKTGCSWSSADPATRTTNRNQAATQLFYLVNAFHDHLAQAPIGFTHAARNFEFGDADGGGPGLGGDPVMAEVDNYLNPGRPTNDASMTTFPDGTPPRLQMFLFTDPSLNSADTADLVYHEYAHGLTTRSIGSGVAIDAAQTRAMGEGWSDWYALDQLDNQGLRPDDPATPGQMTIGPYLKPGGLRTQPADCPVGSAHPACPGRGAGDTGGYTLGDMGRIDPAGFEVHADGEIWLQTLWDLRARLGAATAERLITSGLRLSPNNPSMLEARDAILLADRVAGGTNYEALWDVFKARGMGYGASTTSSAATTAVESFDLPPRLAHESTTVSDAAPGGDGDDVAEPGETISLVERLFNPNPTVTTAVSAILSATTPGVAVGQPSATWPSIGAGLSAAGSPPFELTIPASASCDSTAALDLAVTSGEGDPFTLPLGVPVGSRASTDVPMAVTTSSEGVHSMLSFAGSGPVQDLELRIARLAHTWVGDLVVKLSHGTKTVTLLDRPGAGLEGAEGDDLVDLVLDDDAAVSIDDIPATAPPGGYSGRFRPAQPLSAFDGDDRQGTWTLTVIDAFAASDSGTLYDWSIRPSNAAPCPNRAPRAADDERVAAGGQKATLSTVLVNDYDPDGDAITAVKVAGPAEGGLALAPDGSFQYAPRAGFRGADSFTYRARDSDGLTSAAATVHIEVGNTPPVAEADGYTVTSGQTLHATSVLANDTDANGDPLTALLASGPSHGTLGLGPDGTFAYAPDADFTGRDAFAYRASDGSASSAPTTATITVLAPPAAPPPPPAAAPPPPPATPPPPPAAEPLPAKLAVLRANVVGGKLDVLAQITARATGRVRVAYRSAGRLTSFSAPIVRGRIRIARRLQAPQRRKRTGIVSMSYAGSPRVRPDTLRLRAASVKARLQRRVARIDARGQLRVAGTIASGARGIVRIRLGYTTSDGSVRFLRFRATIRRGRWSLSTRLPSAARDGGQLSIQYTGYEPRRIRGEQLAKAVRPAP